MKVMGSPLPHPCSFVNPKLRTSTLKWLYRNSFKTFFSFIDFERETPREREREREREKERLICCSTSLCIHWLLLVCALTRNRTSNLDLSGWRSNQMSYPDRAQNCFLFTWEVPNLSWWNPRGFCIGNAVALYVETFFTIFIQTKHVGSQK